jgi:hypothetical protein
MEGSNARLVRDKLFVNGSPYDVNSDRYDSGASRSTLDGTRAGKQYGFDSNNRRARDLDRDSETQLP